MTIERFRLDPKGYAAILKSPEIVAELTNRGNRIAAEVRAELAAHMDDPDWEVVVDPYVGRRRANVVVSGVPTWLEDDERIMVRAMDAAR